MERLVLTDAQWAKMEPYCLQAERSWTKWLGQPAFVEAVLWIAARQSVA
jgi:hypothetical protein